MNVTPTVILTGPTATGKTDLSIALARYFNAPVISADSRQCYKYLDIGTGKPNPEILTEIPHYHISTLNPDESYNVSDFSDDFKHWSKTIRKQGKPVLAAGGSTLYIESLIRPLDELPPRNETNLLELQNIADREGLTSIQKKLEKVDPEYAQRIDGPNPHRMFRALDVWMQTGRPFSSFHKNRSFSLPKNTLLICLVRERTELHQRINARVDQMITDGLLEEVRGILDMGFVPNLQSLQTVGYREAIDCIRGRLTTDEMREKIKTNTRRYARRQLTWFRRWKQTAWLDQTGQSQKKLTETVLKMAEQLAAET